MHVTCLPPCAHEPLWLTLRLVTSHAGRRPLLAHACALSHDPDLAILLERADDFSSLHGKSAAGVALR
ncbi:hypothetical protein DPMN_109808 [Dreissena polymorpha]|uniref:Uncharacterized protein n=1 Tax=Dreissena polymorpha TaxID=45954 RepID=A0A9D4KAZ4_DREPO|nr:hypothetical protein DPMN_109808 [Dreissena polymorpha]